MDLANPASIKLMILGLLQPISITDVTRFCLNFYIPTFSFPTAGTCPRRNVSGSQFVRNFYLLTPELIETGVVGLTLTEDGGWIYGSTTFEVLSQNDWGGYGKIIRRDSDFNEVWSKTVTPTPFLTSSLSDLKPTSDGNWVGSGSWVQSGTPGFQGGGLYKISDSGDSIWSRLDTAFWHPTIGSENYLGGLVALPSGSIIAAGYSIDHGQTGKHYGWLIKVDKDGCMDTLCVTTGLFPNLVFPDPISVYPNPATTEITIDFESDFDLEIYNMNGKLIQKQYSTKALTKLDISRFDPGMYVIVFKNGQKQYFKKFVKIN